MFFFVALISVVINPAKARSPERYDFNISQEKLGDALAEFARQAEVQLLFPYELADNNGINSVVGNYTVADALKLLLSGSAFSGDLTKRGVVTVSRSERDLSQIKKPEEGMRKNKKSIFALTFATIFGAGAQQVSGQDELEKQARSPLEEIVVTAQFRNQSVQDIPLAITALSAEMIKQRGDLTLSDIAGAVPNVSFNQGTGLYAGAQFYIRGVGQFDPHPALEPGVGVYIDDVYNGAVWGGDLGLLDLERVEVLRGPQGTLAGANSIGGSVKLFTVKPQGDGSGYFEMGYGTNQTALGRGAFDISLISEKLFFRGSMSLRHDDGYADRVDFACAKPELSGSLPSQSTSQAGGSCAVGRAGGKSIAAVRGALRWLVNDDLEINLAVDASNEDSQPGLQLLSAKNPSVGASYNARQLDTWGVALDERFVVPWGEYITYSDFTDRDGRNLHVDPNGYNSSIGFSTTVDYQINESLSLKSITAYRSADGYTAADFDGSPLNAATASRTIDYEQFTQELRLNGTSLNDFMDWTVGGFYYSSDNRLGGTTNVQTVPLEGGFLFQYNHLAENEKKAVFASATLHPLDKFDVTLGYRYSNSSKDFTYGHYDPNPNGALYFFGTDKLSAAPTSKSDRSDYRVALQYEWTSDLMGYAQVATGYKDGGVNPFPLFPTDVVPFGPEKMTSYEVGLKSMLLDGRMQLNLAGFVSDYKELQLRGQVPALDNSTVVSVITNAGEVSMQGVELEVNYRPVEQFLITASASYIDFEYDSLGSAALVANGPCVTCTNIYTPESKAYISMQYDFTLGNSGTLTPRFELDYQDLMYADLTNNPAVVIPSRSLANARFTYQSPNDDWEASLAIKNVFDEYYYTQIAQQYYSSGVALATPGRPREIMFSVRRTF